MKAAINTEHVRGELTLLHSEFERSSDLASYSQYIDRRNDPAQWTTQGTTMMSQNREIESAANKRMELFTTKALSGILNLLEAKKSA